LDSVALGISNFADSPGKRKDFLDTFAADFVAAAPAGLYSEISTIPRGAEWMIRVSRDCCTRS
jgi:hypothetical protein